MTSASELFCSRRSRYGRNSVELGSDSSFDRISPQNHHSNHDDRRHSHHHNRRERYDLDGCDLPRRSSHHLRHSINHLSHPERDPIRPDQGGIQSSSGNIINLDDSRNIRNRQRITGNDRLPGAVVLARERLLERLRGVSVSGNRQSHRLSFDINHDDFTLGGNSSFIVLEDGETENSRDWLAEVTANTFPPRGRLVASQETKKHPAGLTRDSLDRLHVEVFNNTETNGNGMSWASRDCSICLETFQEGDVLTCLPCEHRFHTCCLDPWVKSCGDCPNCRTAIVVTAYKAIERL